MPTRLLAVRHRPQEDETGCLAACAQMVLQHLEIPQSQADLNRLLGLTSIGAPYSNIRRLVRFNVKVTTQSGTENDLRRAIDRNLPPIAFFFTGNLSYWQDDTSHAAVVVGYDDDTILLNDPQFDDAPKRIDWSEFMLAWGEQDYLYALVSR